MTTGAVVRSRYRRPWIGVVVDVVERSYQKDKTNSPLCAVVPIWSARGKRIDRRCVHWLDVSWLEPIEQELPDDINPDWLRP